MAFVRATFDPLCASPRAQYEAAAAASNRPGTCTEWPPGPRQVCQMPCFFDWGHGASIQHKRRGNWSLFGQLLTLYVHRQGPNATGRLHKIDLVRLQSAPQGPERCVRCPASSVEGTGHRSSTRGGVIGLCLGNY